jgi:protoporphyrinogen oxidase
MNEIHRKQKRVVILGGGLAGLSALWHLQEAGYENCALFEKESRIGGLTRSEPSTDSPSTTQVTFAFKDRTSKLVVGFEHNIHYVLGNSDFLERSLHSIPVSDEPSRSPRRHQECVLGFVQAAANGHRDGAISSVSESTLEFHNFEEWIYSTLGSGIAKHFMLPYNEKLWTVPPKELSCEWMGRFVPGTSLEQILDGALSDHSRNIGYNASFGYPLKGGIEALPRAFGKSLKNVHPGFEVSKLDLGARRVTFRNRTNRL